MLNSLGERICLAIESFVVNHAMVFIVLALLFVAAADFYYRYFRVNRKTDHVDLMKEYNDLQLRRRYRL